MGSLHQTMFYESRLSIQVSDSDPTDNPHTELTYTPDVAQICYADDTVRHIDSNEYDAPNGKGYETAQFLIGRALLDPDAVVIPN